VTSSDVDITGLNRAEVAILWAMARVGGDAELVEGLEPGAADALGPVLEAADGLGADRREELADDWLELETSEVLRSTDSTHFDTLLDLEASEFRQLAGDFGAYQLVALLREKNRRRAVRVAAKLGERRRELVVGALDREYTADRVERTRIREVFVALGRGAKTFRERVAHLGLYSIARAAGTRYRRRIVELTERLPRELAGDLRRYYRRARASSRRGAGRHFREALERFLEWSERREMDDELRENEGE
jgi:hypothetical protein